MGIEARLRELGIDLSDIPPPIADGYVPKFAPWVRSGDHIFLTGRLAKTGDHLLVGKVGADIALCAARSAARDVAIELLGLHARSALVATDLPFGAALEIDLVVEVAPTCA